MIDETRLRCGLEKLGAYLPHDVTRSYEYVSYTFLQWQQNFLRVRRRHEAHKRTCQIFKFGPRRHFFGAIETATVTRVCSRKRMVPTPEASYFLSL